MTALTPEQFLALPPDPDEDLEEEQPSPPQTPTADGQATAPRDSLQSIAASLGQLVSIVVKHDLAEEQEQLALEAHDDLEAKHATLYELVEEIEGIVKSSTSKVSLSVKAAIDSWRKPEAAGQSEPAPVDHGALELGPPAHDAPVEVWREYARRAGSTDVDTLNRSQIRTLLGISQTEAGDES